MKTLKKLRRAYDEIQPVGSEDPERAAALAAHESGETEAQDRRKAKDERTVRELRAKLFSIHDQDAKAKEYFPDEAKGSETVKEMRHRLFKLEPQDGPYSRAKDILPVPIKTSNAVPMPTEMDGEQRYAADAHTESPRPGVTYHYADEPKKPKPIKTFLDHVREGKAAAQAKDTDPRKPLYTQGEWKVMPTHDPDKVQVLRNSQLMNEVEDVAAAKRFIAGQTAKAKDSVVLPLQRGGSEPADHLYRASLYEVQGDRAHALDSYRMAASGFRRLASDATEQYIVTGETTSNGSKQSFFNSKVEADKESEKLKQLGWKNVKVSSANDAARKGEAQARDGINACQTKFAQQYQHPGTGRVKVCDSASTALRTAVERTRAGEVVSVIGKTVRPGRARVCDSREGVWMCSECKTGHTSETELHKHQEKTGHWRTPTGNPLTKEEAGHSQWQAKDGAFAKLEGKLEKEGESKRKASGTDLINAHTWSVSELNSTLAELQRALKDARTPGKPQYGGNTRQIEEDIADAKRALASKSSAKDGAFAKLEGKLEKEGESKQEAGGVAYEAGAAKYGKAGMAAKSAAARDDDTEELAQRIKSLVKELKADGTTNMSTRNLKQLVNTRGLRFANQNHFERAFSEALAKAGVAKFVAMAEEAGRTKAKDSREVQPV
jgi:hypothetical protein